MSVEEINRLIEDARNSLPRASEYEKEEINIPFSRLNTSLSDLYSLKESNDVLDVSKHVVIFRKRETLYNRGIDWEFVAIE